jgi:hypothetical protein
MSGDASTPLPPPSFWVHTAWLVVLRPRLWVSALRQGRRLVGRGWWRRRPFLPVPDAAYLRFRFETQYGSAAPPRPHDVLTYLEWCREMDAMSRANRVGGPGPAR